VLKRDWQKRETLTFICFFPFRSLGVNKTAFKMPHLPETAFVNHFPLMKAISLPSLPFKTRCETNFLSSTSVSANPAWARRRIAVASVHSLDHEESEHAHDES
jgi:hypothetical protein